MIIDENIIIRITPTNFKYYCNVIENIKKETGILSGLLIFNFYAKLV